MNKTLIKIKKVLGIQGWSSYDHKIIIHIGLNAHSLEEARQEAEEIQKAIEVKLGDYLKQFPHYLETKAE